MAALCYYRSIEKEGEKAKCISIPLFQFYKRADRERKRGRERAKWYLLDDRLVVIKMHDILNPNGEILIQMLKSSLTTLRGFTLLQTPENKQVSTS